MTQENSGDSGDKPVGADSDVKPIDPDSDVKPVDARVARRRQDALGRRLRQMYDEVVSEPVPDEFLSFLKTVDDRNAATNKSGE